MYVYRFKLAALLCLFILAAPSIACRDGGGGGDGDGDGDSDSDADGDGDADADGDGDSDGDGDGDGDADPEMVCEAVCTTVMACGSTQYVSPEDCHTSCQAEYMQILSAGVDCRNAQSALQTCMSELSCEEIDAFWERAASDYPCSPVEDDVVDLCFTDLSAVARDHCRRASALAGECTPENRDVRFTGRVADCSTYYINASMDGTDCANAVDAAYDCALVLECTDYLNWEAKTGDSYPCESYDLAISESCTSIEP